MPHQEDFDLALSKMNDMQRAAVSHDRDACIVLGGPGAGKTQVLTVRVASILRQSADDSFRVLALTFTNRAADEMRNRVESYSADSRDRTFIGTFHSFCANVLRQHGHHIGIQTNFKIYSAPEERACIARQAIRSDAGRAAGLHLRHLDFLDAIDSARVKTYPMRSAGTGATLQVDDSECRSFLEVYTAALREANALDFGSLMRCTCELFQRYPVLARRYQSVYRYWCIDEFQDTSHIQYELLKLMAGSKFRNIFAVADEDQIIYQWNGADSVRLSQFRRDFNASPLELPSNYRCPQIIVNCAERLTKHSRAVHGGSEPSVVSPCRLESDSSLRILAFRTELEECRGVAGHIARHRMHDLSSTVVLSRVHRLLNPVSRSLEKLGVASHVATRREDFQSPAFRWIYSAMRMAADISDDRYFCVFVNNFNELAGCNLTAGDLIRESVSNGEDYLTCWDRVVGSRLEQPAAHALAKAVAEHLGARLDYRQFAADAIRAIGTYCGGSRPDANASQLLAEVKEDTRAWDFLISDVERRLGSRLNLPRFLQALDFRSKQPPMQPESVRLMTIHSSKGMEFGHVYLIGLAEDVLPHFHSKEDPALEEERRSCFVAVTRCSKTLAVSYARRYGGYPKAPSRFLAEMGISSAGLASDPAA